MTSGWDVYYVVFLSSLLALIFPALLGIVSRIASRKESLATPELPPFAHELRREPGTDLPSLGRRVNTRFFLGANATLALLVLALMLVPCIGAVGDGSDETGVGAVLGIGFVAVLASVGLLYSVRKGDLDWLRTYEKDKGPEL